MTRLRQAPSPAACGPSPSGLFSHRLWLLGLLVVASGVLVGCGNEDASPAWSPDGTKIAFTSDRDGNEDIYVMTADGTKLWRFTNNPADDAFPAWSPDGTKIAFDSDRDGNWEIYVMNADGTNPTRLTSDPADDFFPAWSPDGTKIAFTSDRDGNWEIYVMNADGTGQTRLTK